MLTIGLYTARQFAFSNFRNLNFVPRNVHIVNGIRSFSRLMEIGLVNN